MKILLADDDHMILQTVGDALREAGMVPDCTNSAAGASQKLRVNTYDCAIIDWQFMPEEHSGVDGLTVVRQIRREQPDLPVLMLSGRGTLMDRVQGLRIGADDYLVKPFFIPELIVRIHSLLRRGQRKMQGDTIRIGNLCIDRPSMTATMEEKKLNLKGKQLQLLLYLVENKDHILSRQRILEDVWGEPGYSLSSNTIDVHIGQIRSALGPMAPHVHTIRSSGYMFVSELDND